MYAGEALVKVCVVTFGCQMNKLDSELIEQGLERAGHEIVTTEAGAEAVLFNTCSVRQHAEEKVYSRLGQLKRRKAAEADFILGVVGCMAQREGRKIFDRAPHVDLVCGTRQFLRVPELLAAVLSERCQIVATSEAGDLSYVRNPSKRRSAVQAFVAVMRGCDNFCSYCVVPYVRGREVSRRPDEIVREVEALAGDGCVEVTLVGQNVNSYGKRFDSTGPEADGSIELADLLERVSTVAGIERVRFVTNHPKDLTERTLAAMAGIGEVCGHLHMPAQSGSDRILALMRRGYTRRDYLDVIAKARGRVPDITFSSDFIVGFPSESDQDVAATRALLEEVRFKNCFVFKYSPRPQTAAERLADDVPAQVKAERNAHLLALQEEVSRQDNAALVGSEQEVLLEGTSPRDAGKLIGRTPGDRIVVIETAPDLVGRIVRVRIADSTPLTLFGALIEENQATLATAHVEERGDG